MFGFHYAVRHGVDIAVKTELGDQAQTMPMVQVDPEVLRKGMEVSRTFDTSAQRAVVQDAANRIDQINRNLPLGVAPPRLPLSPGRWPPGPVSPTSPGRRPR